jgi:chromosome segregation ATPase
MNEIEYDLDLVTEVSECESLIEDAQQDLDNLDDDRKILEVQEGRAEDASSDVAADITVAKSELDGIRSILPTLSGAKKKAYERKETLLGNKLDSLGFRKEDRGSRRLLSKQYALGQIAAQVAEINRFIGLVNARKAVIEQG